MGLKTAIRTRALSRLPTRWRFPIERFYDYYCTGDYVKYEVQAIRKLCSSTRAAVDIGANKGQLTLFLQRYSLHVHCFEPVPQLCEYLRQRFQESNVTVEDCALGNVNSELPLRIPVVKTQRVDTRSSLVKDFRHEQILGEDISHVQEILVPVKKLDDFRLSNVGFIKIDVEGYEAQVLEGARQTILACEPNLLIEIEQRHCIGKDINATFSYVREMGYFGYFLDNEAFRNLDEFDAEEMQNPLNERTKHYINNFAFSRSPL